jgi:hypothetical protein
VIRTDSHLHLYHFVVITFLFELLFSTLTNLEAALRSGLMFLVATKEVSFLIVAVLG